MGIPETMVGRILMLMWSRGPPVVVVAVAVRECK